MEALIKKTNSLISMIDSCFTYGGADVDSYNYSKYIVKHKEELGAELFESVYNERLTYLKANAEIISNVYTDKDGCTYNKLVLK